MLPAKISSALRTEMVHLPEETVSHILNLLADRDLLSAGGVCILWYEIAARLLRKRGKVLYRWPDETPLSASWLCAVGTVGISSMLQKCTGIKVLEICFDEPSKIPPQVLEQVAGMSLEELRLNNVIFNRSNAKTLLASEIQVVRIHTKRKDHLSRRARRLLQDHVELFSVLSFAEDEPSPSLFCSCPNPAISFPSDSSLGEVVPEAKGQFGIRLRDLRIWEASFVKQEDLEALSELDLRVLGLSDCGLPAEAWSSAFDKGFARLSKLSVVSCHFLGLEGIRSILARPCLTSLELDLRHLPHMKGIISVLQESETVRYLRLSCNCLPDELIPRKRWRVLKKLVIINYSMYIFEELLETMVKQHERFNITLRYHQPYSVTRTFLHWNKNLQSF